MWRFALLAHLGSTVPNRGMPPVVICWVSVPDGSGKLNAKGFLSTELGLDALEILSFLMRRWRVEVTFEHVRRYHGRASAYSYLFLASQKIQFGPRYKMSYFLNQTIPSEKAPTLENSPGCLERVDIQSGEADAKTLKCRARRFPGSMLRIRRGKQRSVYASSARRIKRTQQESTPALTRR